MTALLLRVGALLAAAALALSPVLSAARADGGSPGENGAGPVLLSDAAGDSSPEAGSGADGRPTPEMTLAFLLRGDGEADVRGTTTPAGREIGVASYLVDPAGGPIVDAEITVTIADKFMNVVGDVEVGRARTDRNGLATVLFTPRREGENVVTASFAGNDVYAPADATDVLDVVGGAQLYRSISPFRIPGGNVWMVATILGVIWGLYLIAIAIGLGIPFPGKPR